MYYPQEIIEEVRSLNDIVDVISSYLPLRQKGGRLFGLCPFHNEKTPSFSVSDQQQFYYCFGCGAGGNVYSFVMQMENYDFPDAVKYLANKVRYELPKGEFSEEVRKKSQLKKELFALNKMAARYFYDNLSAGEGSRALKYLDKRRISKKLRVKFGLGYSLSQRGSLLTYLQSSKWSGEQISYSGLVIDGRNGMFDRFSGRLMFPIFDVHGQVVAFGGRILGEGEPKYLNSPDTMLFDKSYHLYGINYARQSKKKEFILVEGYMDVLSLFEAGFENTVAALGTALNVNHARLIKKYAEGVIILFDSDDAGERAALRAIPILAGTGLRVRAAQVTGAKDPDEYLQKHGRESFEKLLELAKGHVAFQVDCLKKQYDLQDTDDKVKFTQEASKLLAGLDSSVEQAAYAQEIAKMTQIDKQAIQWEVAQHKNAIQKAPVFLDRKPLEKGVLASKKSLLYLAALKPIVCKSIRAHLSPNELGEAPYEKFLTLVYELNTSQPAEILNYFSTPGDQKMITDIFQEGEELCLGDEDIRVLEKNLNELIKNIKIYNIDQQLLGQTDAAMLSSLTKRKMDVEKLYIKILDG